MARYYMVAEPCDADERVVTGLQAVYGPGSEVLVATLRIFVELSPDRNGQGPVASLVVAVPADVIPPELPFDAHVTVVVDPRRAESYHSLVVGDVEHMQGAQTRSLRIVPIHDQPPPLGSNSLVELPSCPVCLERLDSLATGLAPLRKQLKLPDWPNSSCSACAILEGENKGDTTCMRCGTTKSPWVCLLCGFTGCGRYVHFHAHSHYQESGHRFSAQVETLRIWDYVADRYVHNVQPAASDVQPSMEKAGHADESHDEEERDLLTATYASKLDAIVGEYKLLLEKQKESQQMYYEGQIESLELKYAERERVLQASLQERRKARAEVEKAKASSDKEKKNLVRKATDVERSLREQRAEEDMLHSLNDAMLRDQAKWRKQISEARSKLDAAEGERERLIAELNRLFEKMQ